MPRFVMSVAWVWVGLMSTTGDIVLAADSPAPFGLEIDYRQDPHPASGAPTTAQRAALEEGIARLEAAEAAAGPFAPALTEPLLDLAASAWELQDRETALSLYAAALHRIRVNEGLYSERQLPVVQALMAIFREQGDREALSDRADYFYRLTGSGQPPWNMTKLRAALGYLQWRQEYLSHQSGTYWATNTAEILALYELGEDLRERVCDDPEFAVTWCDDFSLTQLRSYYLIAYRVQPLVSDSPFAMYQPGPDWQVPPSQQRLENIDRSLHRRGVDMLEAALALSPEDVALRLAMADWQWFNGDSRAALDVYRTVRGADPGRFSTPVPLPDLPRFSRDARLADAAGNLRLTATISPRGRVDDIDTVADAEADDWSGRAGRALRRVRFRPALDDSGEPMAAVLDLDLTVLR